MRELQDKVVLVTGASRGIGKAICEVCANQGAKVIASSIEKDLSDAIAASLPGGLENHSSIYLDVTQEKDRVMAFNFIKEKYGRLDGLVNNAGLDFSKPFLEVTSVNWRRIMNVDLDAVFELCQLSIQHFLKQGGGAIVNISSVHTIATYPGSGPYAAAKAAVNAFSKSLACEFAKYYIQINCVAPGLVRTDIWQEHVNKFGSEEEALKYWGKNIPSGRIIEPEEIAEMVSFLLSKRAISINGAVICVDGGMTSQLIACE